MGTKGEGVSFNVVDLTSLLLLQKPDAVVPQDKIRQWVTEKKLTRGNKIQYLSVIFVVHLLKDRGHSARLTTTRLATSGWLSHNLHNQEAKRNRKDVEEIRWSTNCQEEQNW